jgi:hypothetical protein
MSKTVLMLMLAVVSSNAMAEWIEISSSEYTTEYIDPSTRRQNGNMVKLWNMTNYKKAVVYKGRTILSSKVQREYNCDEKSSQIMKEIDYSDSLGRGDAEFGEQNAPLQSHFRGAVSDDLWEFACGKK